MQAELKCSLRPSIKVKMGILVTLKSGIHTFKADDDQRRHSQLDRSSRDVWERMDKLECFFVGRTI